MREFLLDSKRGVHTESFLLLSERLSEEWVEHTMGIMRDTGGAAKSAISGDTTGFVISLGKVLGRSVINTLNFNDDPFNTLIRGFWKPRKYDCGRWGGTP